MIYIKVEDDKSLEMTVYEPIYKGENLSQKITFLIPMQIDDIETQTAHVYLNYVRPEDDIGDVVTLNCEELPYNDVYLRYTIPVEYKLTKWAGDVRMWLNFYAGDEETPVVATTGECIVPIYNSDDITANLEESALTALHQMQNQVEQNTTMINELTTNITGIVGDIVDEAVTNKLVGKADNITYDEMSRELSLTSDGEKIGNTIIVPGDGFIADMRAAVEDEWRSMTATSEDEDVEIWEAM